MLFNRTFGVPNLNVVAKTGNYTLTLADDVVTGSVSGGTFTLTLPSAVGLTGKQYILKRTDQTLGTMLNIATTSSQTINGVTSTTLATQYEELTVISDGANWQAKRYIPSVVTAFTPTSSWVSNVTMTGFWQRIGDSARIKVQVQCTGVPTSTALTCNLPTGLTIDTSKLLSTTVQETLGFGKVNDSSVALTQITVRYSSTSAVTLINLGAAGTYVDEPGQVSQASAAPISFNTGDFVNFEYIVPITNWNA